MTRKKTIKKRVHKNQVIKATILTVAPMTEEIRLKVIDSKYFPRLRAGPVYSSVILFQGAKMLRSR
jgi:hypothetical protein